jgi:hypothetical protein
MDDYQILRVAGDVLVAIGALLGMYSFIRKETDAVKNSSFLVIAAIIAAMGIVLISVGIYGDIGNYSKFRVGSYSVLAIFGFILLFYGFSQKGKQSFLTAISLLMFTMTAVLDFSL